MNQHIITIAALGPDDPKLLTLGAYEAMTGADVLVLRTERHGVADMLRVRGVTFETLSSRRFYNKALYASCRACAHAKN